MARPTLRWQPTAGATRYRVRLRSQMPNGEILQDVDTVTTDLQFTPATALAERHANIRVQIIPDCDGHFAASGPADFRAGIAFLFDPTITCETPRWIARSDAAAAAEPSAARILRWQHNGSARLHELTLFSGADAGVLSRQTLLGTSYSMPTTLPPTPLVASLRARCENGWSDVTQIVAQPVTSR